MKNIRRPQRDFSHLAFEFLEGYGVLALAIVGETWSVDFIEKHILGFAGVLLTWVVFVVGGTGLGALMASLTQPGKFPHDLFYGGCGWLNKNWGALGFVLATGFLGGAMGSAPYYKAAQHRHLAWLLLAGATLYATLWLLILPLLVPLFRLLPLVGHFF